MSAAPELAGPRLLYKSAAEITPTKPDWLWQGWIELRALNLMTGRQGSGKTTFVSYILSAITTGAALPGDTPREPMRAAILSLEESEERLISRLRAGGADLSAVQILGQVEATDSSGKTYLRPWRLPADISVLASVIDRERLALVIVDGLGYSITGDNHNYAVVGSALSALASTAKQTGAAILGLVHPPKGSSDPATAAIGSTAWTAIPRVSIVLGVDPTDDTGLRRVVRIGKTNHKMPDSGFSFTIADNPEWECGFVTDIQPSDVGAEDLMSGPVDANERSERSEAKDLLTEILSAGLASAADVNAAAEAIGISRRTLARARKDLGVLSIRDRDHDSGQTRSWRLELPVLIDRQASSPPPPTVDWHSGNYGSEQDIYSALTPERHSAGGGIVEQLTRDTDNVAGRAALHHKD